jgi:hypothetical protein
MSDNKAMNLTFGDLIIVEIALVHYVKDLDLSMQSGQYISELLGKVEYTLAQLRQAGGGIQPKGFAPPVAPPELPR